MARLSPGDPSPRRFDRGRSSLRSRCPAREPVLGQQTRRGQAISPVSRTASSSSARHMLLDATNEQPLPAPIHKRWARKMEDRRKLTATKNRPGVPLFAPPGDPNRCESVRIALAVEARTNAAETRSSIEFYESRRVRNESRSRRLRIVLFALSRPRHGFESRWATNLHTLITFRTSRVRTPLASLSGPCGFPAHGRQRHGSY